MPDIHTETRFTPNHLMREHGIVSGMSVVIEGREHPFGVLNASAKHSRRFTENDINFLKSIANVLASAIERKQAEDALHRSEQAAQKSALENVGHGGDRAHRRLHAQHRRGLRTILPQRPAKSVCLSTASTITSRIRFRTRRRSKSATPPGRSVAERNAGNGVPAGGHACPKRSYLLEATESLISPSRRRRVWHAHFQTTLPMWRRVSGRSLLAPLVIREARSSARWSSCPATRPATMPRRT